MVRLREERERLRAQQEEAYRQSYEGAIAVGRELRSILRMAAVRGLSMEQSFQHFDDKGMGYVDVDDFVDGLARLGIGLSSSAAEILMSMIGRSSSLLFRCDDLHAFLEAPEPSPPEQSNVIPSAAVPPSGAQQDADLLATYMLPPVQQLAAATRTRRMGDSTRTFPRQPLPPPQDQPDARLPPSKGDKVQPQGDVVMMSETSAMCYTQGSHGAAADLGKTSLLFPIQAAASNTKRGGQTLRGRTNGRPLPAQSSSVSGFTTKQQADGSVEEGFMSTQGPMIADQAQQATGRHGPPAVGDASSSFDPRPAAWARGKTKEAYQHMLRAQRAYLEKQKKWANKRGRQVRMGSDGQEEEDGDEDEEEQPGGGGDEGGEEQEHQHQRQHQKKSMAKTGGRSTTTTRRGMSTMRESGSSTMGGGATTVISIPGLNLEGMAVEPLARDGGEELDCFCHIDDDTVLTYRVLRSTLRPRARKHGSVLEEMAEAKAAAEALRLLQPELQVGFMMMVLPDVFMTLDTLQEALEPLLDRHPRGSVLLVGLPGMPHTLWPAKAKLSNDQNALYAAQMLAHLQERRLWGIQDEDPSCPLFLLGFGAGASVALKLATSYLTPEVRASVESVVLVNPVTAVDKQLKRTLGDLQKVLLRAKHYERVNLLTYLNFSDSFLASAAADPDDHHHSHHHQEQHHEGGHRRQEPLEEFWSTRGSVLAGSTLLGGTSTTHDEGEGGTQHKLTREAPIIRKLQGLLHNSDALPLLEACSLPVVLVQSSENRLFAPLPMEVLQQHQHEQQKKQRRIAPGEERGYRLVDSPRLCLRSTTSEVKDNGTGHRKTPTANPLHVSWLKSGHEVLQERRVFMLKLLDKLILQACQNRQGMRRASVASRMAAPLVPKTDADDAEQDESLDDEDSGLGGEGGDVRVTEGEESSSQEGGVGESNAAVPSAAGANKTEKEEDAGEAVLRRWKPLGAAAAAAINSAPPTPALSVRDSAESSGHVFHEESEETPTDEELPGEGVSAQEIARLQALRKEQQEKYNRQRQVRAFREKDNKMVQKQREKDEQVTMTMEDQRSRLAEDYVRECAKWEKQAQGMRARGVEIREGREEVELEKVEEEMRRKRAAKYEQRRKQVDDVKARTHEQISRRGKEMELAAQNLEGGLAGLDDMMDNVVERFKDMTRVRLALVDSLKQHRLLEGKVKLLWGKYQDADDDVRNLRRALRLLETNAALKASAPTRREIDLLTKKMDAKMEAQQELHGLWKAQAEYFDLVNFKVQTYIVQLAERERLLLAMFVQVQGVEKQLNAKVGSLRIEKENLTNKKHRRENELPRLRARLNKVMRIRGQLHHHDKKYVDTDAWIDGVIQRVPTAALIEKLEGEEDQLKDSIAEAEHDLGYISTRFNEIEEETNSTMAVTHRVTGMREAVERSFNAIKERSPMDELVDQVELEEKAAVQTGGMPGAPPTGEGLLTLAYKVRHTLSSQRTKEEKKWVAMDVLVNPGCYTHVSEIEADEMKFDDDYEIMLEKEEVQRLLKLPCELQLALPFLHSPDQLYAHKLLAHFSHGKGEEYYRSQDQASQDDPRSTVVDPLKGASDEAEARMVLELLMRERRVSRLHATIPSDRIKEEQDYVKMDRVLRPSLYEEEDRLAEEERQRVAKSNMSLEDVKTRELPGDQYDEARKRFIQENDEDWTCRWTKEELTTIYKLTDREAEGWAAETQDDYRKNAADVQYVRSLMKKYYVPDEDSRIGRKMVNVLMALTTAVSGPPQGKQEHDTDEEEFSNKAAALDDLFSQLKGPASQTEGEKQQQPARVFGSWNVAHPAAAGMESQQSAFHAGSEDHPASFSAAGSSSYDAGGKSKKHGRRNSTLAVAPQPPPEPEPAWKSQASEQGWMVVKSLEDLSALAGTKKESHQDFKVLVALPEPRSLLEEQNMMLEARQSRCHEFIVEGGPIGYGGTQQYAFDITVTIVFQGTFSVRGYRLGRVAAMLYRLQHSPHKADDPTIKPVPVAVGYAPVDMASLNTPTAMGKIVIYHCPQKGPILPNSFQVIVGAASSVKYSIHVSCRVAEDAETVIDRSVARTKELQLELPKFKGELTEIFDSLRLAERKLGICKALLDEAEAQNARVSAEIGQCNAKLLQDDETMEMDDEERAIIIKDIQALEQEFGYWCKIFSGRMQEKKCIMEGLEFLRELRLRRALEQEAMTAELERLQRYVPSAIFVTRGKAAAVAASLELNLSIANNADAAVWARRRSSGGKEDENDQHSSSKALVMTPAEIVRHRYRTQGFDALLLDEQQWSMLDRALNPDEYKWLAEQEEKKYGAHPLGLKGEEPPKYPLAVEKFRYRKEEVERILATPFHELERKEVHVRKLMTRFHDNPQLLIKTEAAVVDDGLLHFDPNIGPRARNRTAQERTVEEREWVSVDRVLNPDLYSLMKLEKFGKKMTLIELQDVGGSPEEDAAAGGGVQDGAEEGGQGGDGKTKKKSLKVKIKDDSRGKKKRGSVSQVSVRPEWSCPFSRTQLMQLWGSKTEQELRTEDERRAWRLLMKYSGSQQAYLEYDAAVKVRKALQVAAAWDLAGKHIDYEKRGRIVTTDIDERTREVLHEIDKVCFNSNLWTSSAVLHMSDQKFPTKVLRVELERELDRLLREQMMERERLVKRMEAEGGDDQEGDFKAGIPGQGSDDHEETDGDQETRLKARAEQRKGQRQIDKDDNEEEEVRAARKRIKLANKSAAEIEQAKEADALGPTGCLACMKRQCAWVSTIDRDTVTRRQEAISDELNFIRDNETQEIFESVVPLSAQRGGAIKFHREDIVMELQWEAREIERRLRLDLVDKEFHDSCATRKEFIEVEALHGYRTVLWTGNAKKALAEAQSRLVATIVATDIVEDILEFMLEGWVFGERESEFSVAGYVPSVKADGPIRAGSDQMRAATLVQERAIQKAKAEADDGMVFPEDEQGTPFDKVRPIELERRFHISKETVVKKGDDRDKILNETENTLRFGLFSLTFMYFRSMMLLQREKESWGGRGDAIGGQATSKVTSERKRMILEQRNIENRAIMLEQAMQRAKTGEERRRARQEKERADAAMSLYEKLRKEKLETKSTQLIQRVYRGHLGRKAARRWCMKRAELDAMAALLNASVINIQRVYRGHMGRMKAREARMDMAEFINRMRTIDATEDEEDYWAAHPYQRFKRDLGEVFKDVLALGRGGAKLRKAQMEALELDEQEEDEEEEENEEAEEEEGGGDDAATTTRRNSTTRRSETHRNSSTTREL